MKPRCVLVVLLMGISFTGIPVRGQEIRVDLGTDKGTGSGFFDKWDSVQDRVILYRDVGVANAAAVRMPSEKGQNVTIYPLRDLPDAQGIAVWDVAASPNGGVVVSAVAQYGARDAGSVPTKPLLLIYDSSGVLRQVWDTAPYHHIFIAVDKEGDVFGFGDTHRSGEKEPLLIKYSSSGRVLGKFLPAGGFESRHEAVSTGSSLYGESAMFLSGEELDLWLAPIHELLRFSLKGELLARMKLSPAIDNLTNRLGLAHIRVSRMSLSKEYGYIAQVTLWPKDENDRVTFGIMRVSKDGSEATLVGPASEKPSPGRLVGATSGGRMVFLQAQEHFGTYTVY